MVYKKVSFDIVLLFFVSLLGGIISTTVYKLNFSLPVLLTISGINIAIVVGLVIFEDYNYKKQSRNKDSSDKKETRDNTRKILKRMDEEEHKP